jgi:hypothetical protein
MYYRSILGASKLKKKKKAKEERAARTLGTLF